MNYKRNIELMVGQFTTAITSHFLRLMEGLQNRDRYNNKLCFLTNLPEWELLLAFIANVSLNTQNMAYMNN